MRQDTLLFLLKDDTEEILLAMKKRGFGAGKLNGVGGKVGENEGIVTAAVREAYEEIKVTVREEDLEKAGEISFHFDGKPEQSINCHIFLTRAWTGEPAESEEMAPGWFARDRIPFEKMWVDDKFWLLQILAGKRVAAEFHFVQDGSSILRQRVDFYDKD